MYQISPVYLLRAVGAAAAAGALGGFLWAYLFSFSLGIIFAVIVGAGLGSLVSLAINLATNRKRGPQLQLIGGGGVILAYVVRGLLESAVEGHSLSISNDLGGLILVSVAIAIVVNQLR
jgi:hypothetical protein